MSPLLIFEDVHPHKFHGVTSWTALFRGTSEGTYIYVMATIAPSQWCFRHANAAMQMLLSAADTQKFIGFFNEPQGRHGKRFLSFKTDHKVRALSSKPSERERRYCDCASARHVRRRCVAHDIPVVLIFQTLQMHSS